ncbi:hypothetical protein [Catalinimonas alkaloidigena]|nr:hypothetical protein [Catalinimonas alkaloidigena]
MPNFFSHTDETYGQHPEMYEVMLSLLEDKFRTTSELLATIFLSRHREMLWRELHELQSYPLPPAHEVFRHYYWEVRDTPLPSSLDWQRWQEVLAPLVRQLHVATLQKQARLELVLKKV